VKKCGVDYKKYRNEHPAEKACPFHSGRKRFSVIIPTMIGNKEERVLFIKGNEMG